MIGWRHIVPRRRYFQSLKIAKLCPEIVWHIEEGARLTALSYLVGAVYFPTIGLVILVSAAMTIVGGFVLSHVPRMPDYAWRKGEIIEEAWKITPREEILRRLGKEPSRIISKKVEGGYQPTGGAAPSSTPSGGSSGAHR